MSEENRIGEEDRVNEASGANAPAAGDANQNVDDLMKAHMQRWQQRAQIIVAVVFVFILYMIWFMLHSN